MIVRKFKLALNAGKSIPLVIHANQYDHDEQWEFTLYNDDWTQYIPSSGAIVGIKSDNLGIINSGTVSGGVVIINETEQMTAAPGKAVFELMIDSQTHGTANFIVLVEPKPGDNATLSESDLSLLQEAIDSTSPVVVAENVSEWLEDNITPTTPAVDASLTVSGAAADAKATGERIAAVESTGGGLTADIKEALLACFEKVAWIDANGQDYYDDLEAALYPPANLSYITAVYTQSGTVYTTDTLDSLKPDLVVTAHYSDSTTATVTDYVLSGTLAEGTSTITVTYGGKTTTFTVTVTERGALYPLANGTYTTEGTNPTYQFTVTDGKHVKFESLRSISSQCFANLHSGSANSQAIVVNNQTELFSIPANTEAVLNITNVVNSSDVSFNFNFRKASASTSSSFGIGDGTHADGATVTKTLTTAESVGCAFFYHTQAEVPVGSIVEFDVSFTVGGARYI